MKYSCHATVNLSNNSHNYWFRAHLFKKNNRALSTKAFYRKYIQAQCLMVCRTIKDVISGLFTESAKQGLSYVLWCYWREANERGDVILCRQPWKSWLSLTILKLESRTFLMPQLNKSSWLYQMLVLHTCDMPNISRGDCTWPSTSLR